MRALIQRVQSASVDVDGETVGKIGQGLLVLAGAAREDGNEEIDLLARKISGMRIFADGGNKFSLSVLDIGGAILLVSQFTLFADCRKGRRPGFSNAAAPELAEPLIERMAGKFREQGIKVETGVFGAMMNVSLVNDGPVTIWLDTQELRR
jgi:D-tyrosyl-tRNA(Tyr) deacylase